MTYLLNILNPCFRFSCTFFADCWITLGARVRLLSSSRWSLALLPAVSLTVSRSLPSGLWISLRSVSMFSPFTISMSHGRCALLTATGPWHPRQRMMELEIGLLLLVMRKKTRNPDTRTKRNTISTTRDKLLTSRFIIVFWLIFIWNFICWSSVGRSVNRIWEK